MGLLTSSLQIGKSALLSYQAALQVVGNNMANAGNAQYTRQTAILQAIPGVRFVEGIQPGAGVAITNLKRNIDEQLETRFRSAVSDQEQTYIEQRSLGRIESLLNELTETDLSTYLNNFFNSFAQLQADPGDLTLRDIVVINGDALTTAMQRQQTDLENLAEELNEQLIHHASSATRYAEDIARLNGEILAAESSARTVAAPLRDQRDEALRELSKLIEIRTVNHDNGSVAVYIGSEPMVEFDGARALTTTEAVVNGQRKVTVRFADNKSAVKLEGGTIAGTVASRDTHVSNQLGRLNQLAQALIEEVNKLHASGQGLSKHTDLTGTYAVLDSTVALNTASNGLDLIPTNGSFIITTYGTDGSPIETKIDVDLDGIGGNDMTLDDLATAIGGVPGLAATVTSAGQLQITAATGTSFTFKEDSSNVLAALGLNTFFEGQDASDIEVGTLVKSDRRFLAAALDGLSGDGSNAQRLALVGDAVADSLSGSSIMDYYKSMVSGIAVAGAAARSASEAATVIAGSLTAQRESVSGVSLDEESIEMLRLERAFQGTSRYIQVVDTLIEEMLSLVR